MDLRFAPNGYLQIDDARITYKNFTGAASKFNREGERDFTLIITDGTITDMTGRTYNATADEIAEALLNDVNRYGAGWNVKIKPPRMEGERPFISLKVKVRFTEWGPNCYLISRGRKVRLDESSIHRFDKVAIETCNLDIRPYDDTISGRPFRSAQLQSIEIYQRIVDRFAEEEYPME